MWVQFCKRGSNLSILGPTFPRWVRLSKHVSRIVQGKARLASAGAMGLVNLPRRRALTQKKKKKTQITDHNRAYAPGQRPGRGRNARKARRCTRPHGAKQSGRKQLRAAGPSSEQEGSSPRRRPGLPRGAECRGTTLTPTLNRVGYPCPCLTRPCLIVIAALLYLNIVGALYAAPQGGAPGLASHESTWLCYAGIGAYGLLALRSAPAETATTGKVTKESSERPEVLVASRPRFPCVVICAVLAFCVAVVGMGWPVPHQSSYPSASDAVTFLACVLLCWVMMTRKKVSG